MVKKIKNIVFHYFVNVLAASLIMQGAPRRRILNLFGLKIGNTDLRIRLFFKTKDVEIDQGTLVNSYCKFFSHEDGGTIKIGKKCFVGMNTLFCTYTHEIGSSEQRAGKNIYFPITVEDGCWIGANVTVLPGVTIGKGCIIAAGSVVTKGCEPNGLYAGVPAMRKKDLD